jgi:hypothetical protein
MEAHVSGDRNLEDNLRKATLANRERGRAELDFETALARNADDDSETPGQHGDWPYDASAPELATAASAIYTLREGAPGTAGQA